MSLANLHNNSTHTNQLKIKGNALVVKFIVVNLIRRLRQGCINMWLISLRCSNSHTLVMR